MADKIKKNLLGRNVTVQRKAMSDGSLAKTRTVTSKSGGTISSKTSYKDAGSVAGKMRVNKIKKAAAEGSRVGGSKIDQKISENRKPYTPTNVKKYASGKTKQVTNPSTGLVTNVRRSGNVKSFVDPSTGESQVYRPRVVGNPQALKKETNAQGVTTKFKRSGKVKKG